MKRALIWLVLSCAALAESSCSTSAAPPQVVAPAPTCAALLKTLRGRLDDVRARPADADPYENWGEEDVRPLLGLSRSDLEQALGLPEGCRMEGARQDCRADSQWQYSFYRLPDGSLGGGPELTLEFDARGVVTTAEWLHSK